MSESFNISGGTNLTMLWLLLLSTIACTGNTLLYKVTLNSFSSPDTNYGFFVSQFSIFLYTIQAVIMSVFVLYQNSATIRDITQIPHLVYVNMAGLDAASGTLSAIGKTYIYSYFILNYFKT